MSKVKFMSCILFILLLSVSLEATYHKIGHCGEPYLAKDLELIDSTMLVPDDAGIHIIDVNEPNNPIYLDCIEIKDTCRDIEVSGDIAYIANSTEGLLILDVSEPQSPQIIGSLDTPGFALSLVVSDSIVYIADRHSGLQIIDVSDPQNPELIGNFETTSASQLALSDTLIFITNYMGNLQVVDVSDPTEPTLIYELYTPQNRIKDVAIVESIAYMATDNSEFVIYDISNPTNFNLIATYEVTYISSITISQNRAYISCSYGGFQILDISDISEPELIGSIKTPTSARNVVISDAVAYIIDQYTGLEVYDISEPYNPDCIGSVDTSHYASSVEISGEIGYVAENNPYLQIVDLSFPSSPLVVNCLGLYGAIKDFIVVGNYGYAITSSRLYALSLSDPVHPAVYSYIDLDGTCYALKYKESRVFISSSAGLYIVDISNQANLHIISECDTPGNGYDLVVTLDNVYIADGNAGLTIIDITNLENPVILPHLSTERYVYSLAKYYNILYLACGYDGLQLVDIINPANPVYFQNITSHPDSRFKTKPIIIDDKLIVEDRNWNEILTFDVSFPPNPELINTYIWNMSSMGFAVFGEYLVTANNYYGISILDLESITSNDESIIVLQNHELNNYPNPFNPTTTISFSIPENTESIELNIYNLKGQKVKDLSPSLCHPELVEGQGETKYSVIWNGENESGKPVSSGIYLYKLNVNGKTEAVKKMLLLK